MKCDLRSFRKFLLFFIGFLKVLIVKEIFELIIFMRKCISFKVFLFMFEFYFCYMVVFWFWEIYLVNK